MTMGFLRQIPAVATAVAALAFGTVEGLYAGGGLTILSRNDLNGKPRVVRKRYDLLRHPRNPK